MASVAFIIRVGGSTSSNSSGITSGDRGGTPSLSTGLGPVCIVPNNGSTPHWTVGGSRPDFFACGGVPTSVRGSSFDGRDAAVQVVFRLLKAATCFESYVG